MAYDDHTLVQGLWLPRQVAARRRVASRRVPPHAPAMFVVTEADAAAICAVLSSFRFGQVGGKTAAELKGADHHEFGCI